MTIRILLADDHELIRAGIRCLLEQIDGVDVVAEAGDGAETVSLAEALRPDLVLLNIGMPKLNGLEAAARLSAMTPPIVTLIFSGYDSHEYVARALRAGSSGYLLKSAKPAELEVAVRAVARGDSYLSPGISKHLVEDYLNRAGGPITPLEALTPRQREILQLVAEGHTSKDIAERLGLSFKTVESHRAHIMDRIGAHDLTALVRFAVSVGLISVKEIKNPES